jgi:S1-C subfamily serine protease
MRRLLLAALLGVLALAGCGGGGSSSGTRTVTVTTGGQAGVQQGTGGASSSGGGGGGGESLGALDPHRIYANEAQGVVTVIALSGSAGGGQGSGFVVSDRGEVLTNAHVVTEGEGAALRRADQVYVQFNDRNEVAAKIVGVDPNGDVALLKVDPNGLNLRPLPLAHLKDVVVGEPVAAIGSPYGEAQSLSVGVVSAMHRAIQSLTGFAIADAIQTDAAINSGNSGGPLIDADGRVIGINSQIKSASGAGSGVGFAVSSDTARRSYEALRTQGKVRYAYLGVSTVSVYPQLGDRFHLGTHEGAWVQRVEPGGPAAKAGIRGGSGTPVRFQAQLYRPGGDVIVKVAGHAVRHDTDLSRLLEPYQPGDDVQLELRRNGKPLTVTVTLGERPAAPGA